MAATLKLPLVEAADARADAGRIGGHEAWSPWLSAPIWIKVDLHQAPVEALRWSHSQRRPGPAGQAPAWPDDFSGPDTFPGPSLLAYAAQQTLRENRTWGPMCSSSGRTGRTRWPSSSRPTPSITSTRLRSGQLVAEVGPKVRAIVTTGERGATRALIERCPALEIVSCFGVGTDAIDHAACREHGVPITNTPDVLTDEVADMGLVLMLSLLRQIPAGDRWVRDGRWVSEGTMPLTRCARNKTLGILGLGRIGRALARRAELLGMKVTYHGRRPQSDVSHRYYDSLVDMARDADVLALCLPGGADTRAIVTAEVLDALGPRAISSTSLAGRWSMSRPW